MTRCRRHRGCEAKHGRQCHHLHLRGQGRVRRGSRDAVNGDGPGCVGSRREGAAQPVCVWIFSCDGRLESSLRRRTGPVQQALRRSKSSAKTWWRTSVGTARILRTAWVYSRSAGTSSARRRLNEVARQGRRRRDQIGNPTSPSTSPACSGTQRLARRLPFSLCGGGREQACDRAHATTHIRDPSVGKWGGRAHHPGPTRPRQPLEHSALYASRHQDDQ